MRGVNSCRTLSARLWRGWGTLTHLDVVGEQSVEKVDIGGPEMHQVLELLNWRRLHSQKLEAWAVRLGANAGVKSTHIAVPAPRSFPRKAASGRRCPGTCGPLAGLRGRSHRSCGDCQQLSGRGVESGHARCAQLSGSHGRPLQCGGHVCNGGKMAVGRGF